MVFAVRTALCPVRAADGLQTQARGSPGAPRPSAVPTVPTAVKPTHCWPSGHRQCPRRWPPSGLSAPGVRAVGAAHGADPLSARLPAA